MTLLRALSLAVMTGACAWGSSGSEPGVRDSSGIRIVENVAPRWTAATAWRVADTATLTIGGPGTDSLSEITQVVGAVRMRHGRIAVVSDGGGQLRLYGSDGQHLRAVGRPGDGPGEFRQILAVARFEADSLFVAEGSRHQVFAPDGQFVRLGGRSIPDLPFGAPSTVLPDGSYLTLRPLPGRLERPGRGGGEWPDSATVDWISADGTRAAELGRFLREIRYASPMAPAGFPRQFGASLQLAGGEDWFYAGSGDAYEVAGYRRVPGEQGTGEWVGARLAVLMRRRVAPEPVTGRMQEEQRARFLSALEVKGRPVPPRVRAMAQQAADGMVFAATLPPYNRLLIDDDGNLWVRRYDPRESDDVGGSHWRLRVFPWSVPWDVFAATGVWLGTVAMPPRFEVISVGRDAVLGLSQDVDGVESVTLRALRKP